MFRLLKVIGTAILGFLVLFFGVVILSKFTNLTPGTPSPIFSTVQSVAVGIDPLTNRPKVTTTLFLGRRDTLEDAAKAVAKAVYASMKSRPDATLVVVKDKMSGSGLVDRYGNPAPAVIEMGDIVQI